MHFCSFDKYALDTHCLFDYLGGRIGGPSSGRSGGGEDKEEG